uniref:Major capsid protein n=1 Tax=Megaviridae environmental sample TaxID=1737588 RepID=A0A5J6VP73_9VIRU|nr:MAG: major capsid protein [Megaviridae environmental sample]
MPGGLLNLIGVGEANVILNGNPKKSFWKATYSKYTNFGLQKFRIDYKGQRLLNFNESTTFSFSFPRHGDLIVDTFLAFKLPHIWSPLFPTTAYTNDTSSTFIPYEFKWIHNLGTKMIQEIEIMVGSTTIQKYSGDYLQSVIERDFDNSKRTVLNEMIKNTDTYNNPGKNDGGYAGKKNQVGYPNAVYDSSPGGAEPSIRGEYLYVPLNLWYMFNSKQAFPLVALQYNELAINITLRPVKELFRIRDVTSPEQNFNYIAPNPNNRFHQFYYFLQEPPANVNSVSGEDEIIYTEEDFYQSYVNRRIDWENDIHLISTYAFLDDQERELFAKNDQEYLIKNVYENIYHNVAESDKIETNSNGMVASWMWFARRSDVHLRNEWSNYTNWEYLNSNPSEFSIPNFSSDDITLLKNKVLPIGGKYLPPQPQEIVQYLKQQQKSYSNVVPIWPQQGSSNYLSNDFIDEIVYLSDQNENTLNYTTFGKFVFNNSEYKDSTFNGLSIGTYKITNNSNELITFYSNELHKFTISGNVQNIIQFKGKQLYYYKDNVTIEVHEPFSNLEMKNITNNNFQTNFVFVNTPTNFSNDVSLIKNLNKLYVYVPLEANLTSSLKFKVNKDICDATYLILNTKRSYRGIAAKIVLNVKTVITETLLDEIKQVFSAIQWNAEYTQMSNDNNMNSPLSIQITHNKQTITVSLFYKIKIILQDNHNPISVYGLINERNNPYVIDLSGTTLNMNDWEIDPIQSRYYINVKTNDVWSNVGGPEEGLSWTFLNKVDSNNLLLSKNRIQKNSIFGNYWGFPDKDGANLPYGFYTSGSYNENYQKTIIKYFTIIVDGKIREERLKSDIYIYLESLFKSNGLYGDGLYFYNFQLKSDPYSIQPSGAMNFSKFKKVEIEVELITPPIKQYTLYNTVCNTNVNNESDILAVKKDVNTDVFEYTYNIHLFEERYNILRFMGGTAGLMYHL